MTMVLNPPPQYDPFFMSSASPAQFDHSFAPTPLFNKQPSPFQSTSHHLFSPPVHPSPEPVIQHQQIDPSHYIALDAEFVGVGDFGLQSALARVSICDYYGELLLDTFCAPSETVTDYRSWVSGVREADLLDAPTFAQVQTQVGEIIRGKILVGHAVHNDLMVLGLTHPAQFTRDTALYEPLHNLSGTVRPSLRALAKLVLDRDVQISEHSSIEDARVTMQIFRAYQGEWEQSLTAPSFRRNNSSPAQAFYASPPSQHGAEKRPNVSPTHNSRSFSSPAHHFPPRVNLPSPAPLSPMNHVMRNGTMNPMLDPRFSAAGMALPLKEAMKAGNHSPTTPTLARNRNPSPPASTTSSKDSRESNELATRRRVVGLAHARKNSSQSSNSKRKAKHASFDGTSLAFFPPLTPS